MTKAWRCWTTFLLLSFFPSVASAAFAQESNGFAGKLRSGVAVPSAGFEDGVKSGFMYGYGLGYHFDEQLNVYFEGYSARFNLDGSDHDILDRGVSVGLNGTLHRIGAVGISARLGAAWHDLDRDRSGIDATGISNWGVELGGGLRIPLQKLDAVLEPGSRWFRYGADGGALSYWTFEVGLSSPR